MKKLAAFFAKIRTEIDPLSALFLALSIPMAVGFIHYSVVFAKIGIPIQLPSSFGQIANFAPSIFITELYLLALAGISLVYWLLNWPGLGSVAKRAINPLTILVCLLLAIGFIRLIPDLPKNPILVIRNAAFVWYLLLSLAVACYPVRPRVLEWYFLFVACYGFAFFSYSAALGYLHKEIAFAWLPYVGLYGPLGFALVTKRWAFALPILLFVSMGLGADYWAKYQRTTLVGMLALAPLLFLLFWKLRARMAGRLATFGVLIFLCVQISSSFRFTQSKDFVAEGNPFVKSGAAQSNGVESFRYYMWKDALDLFLENPILGIGFKEQVVYRIFGGADKYVPNDSKSWGDPSAPPISGPHNSYLNALARIGIAAILLLALHLVSICALWARGRHWAAALIYGQAIYAFFNVGLEGPTRSFFLLLAIGLAIKEAPEWRAALSELKGISAKFIRV